MKILIINTSDIQGGAARAAYRLHQSLLSQNIESQMLVQNKSSDEFTVKTTTNTRLQKLTNILRPYINNIPLKFYKNRTKTLFSTSMFGSNHVIEKINKFNPDIVHLHWICGGMLKIEDLSKIKAPIVWSLHDMWAFTGGCHYDELCEGYLQECGNCKVLGSSKENDLSKKVFYRKEQTYSKISNMTVIGLSRWINECSKNSTLLKNKKHIHLPNPIDTKIFKPFDKKLSRKLWNLPEDKKLVLFGAMGATSDPRKGFKELSKALNKLNKSTNIELVVFGSSKPENELDFGFKIHYLGHLHDDVGLVTLYSAVDVMVVPSLQENLSNAIMESLSCAIPVVVFDIGGNSDMIEHQKNGYLAKPFDSKDLATGIEWIVSNENYDKLSKNAREKVLNEFDSKVVAQKYIDLYKEVLHER